MDMDMHGCYCSRAAQARVDVDQVSTEGWAVWQRRLQSQTRAVTCGGLACACEPLDTGECGASIPRMHLRMAHKTLRAAASACLWCQRRKITWQR